MRLNRENQNLRLSFLGVCSGLGQSQSGLEFGPKVLRDSGILEDIVSHEIEVYDAGDLVPEASEASPGWCFLKRLRDKAFSILQNKELLLSIGGDHSISIGTVQATLLAHPAARLIWIDAHGDINTPETSPSGNLHGMPLAALLGLFQTSMNGPTLLPKNLLIIGARDIDPAERVFLEELCIEVISADEVLRKPAAVLKKVRDWIESDPSCALHLSFDIDAIDPSIAPATGLHVPCGLTVGFSKDVVSLIAQTGQLVSVDFVELNPLRVSSQLELQQTINCAKSILVEMVLNLKNGE